MCIRDRDYVVIEGGPSAVDIEDEFIIPTTSTMVDVGAITSTTEDLSPTFATEQGIDIVSLNKMTTSELLLMYGKISDVLEYREKNQPFQQIQEAFSHLNMNIELIDLETRGDSFYGKISILDGQEIEFSYTPPRKCYEVKFNGQEIKFKDLRREWAFPLEIIMWKLSD